MGTTTPAPADLQGCFAVPDPDQPDRMTFWTAGGSRLNPWPEGTRWAPLPPRIDHAEPDRKERLEGWYRSTYHPWKRRVIAAIEADREGAARRFLEQFGTVEVPESSPRSPRSSRPPRSRRGKRSNDAQRQRIEEQLLASILRNAGQSYREIGEALKLPKTTAYRRERQAVAVVGADHVLVWSLLLSRASEIEATLYTAMISQTGPVDPDRVERWITDLRESCRVLQTAGLGQGLSLQ